MLLRNRMEMGRAAALSPQGKGGLPALSPLTEGRVQAGEWVLVQDGRSGVGMAAIQIAKLYYRIGECARVM